MNLKALSFVLLLSFQTPALAGGDPCGSGWEEEGASVAAPATSAMTLSPAAFSSPNFALDDGPRGATVFEIFAFMASMSVLTALVVFLPALLLPTGGSDGDQSEERTALAEKIRLRLEAIEVEKGALLRELEPLERDQQVQKYQRLKAERA